MYLNIIAAIFSGISFIVYGIASFNSKRMVSEFTRWGLKKLRYIIGFFQLIGGIGLLIGLFYSTMLSLFSFCLSLMMIIAVFVRVNIKDSMVKMLPAIFYAILNGVIFYNSLSLNS